jgi:hypothetical protein
MNYNKQGQCGGGFIQDMLDRTSPIQQQGRRGAVSHTLQRRDAMGDIYKKEDIQGTSFLKPKMYKAYMENIPRKLGEIHVHPYDKILVYKVYNDGWVFGRILEVADKKNILHMATEGYFPFHVFLRTPNEFDNFIKEWYNEKQVSYNAGLPKQWYQLPVRPPPRK